MCMGFPFFFFSFFWINTSVCFYAHAPYPLLTPCLTPSYVDWSPHRSKTGCPGTLVFAIRICIRQLHGEAYFYKAASYDFQMLWWLWELTWGLISCVTPIPAVGGLLQGCALSPGCMYYTESTSPIISLSESALTSGVKGEFYYSQRARVTVSVGNRRFILAIRSYTIEKELAKRRSEMKLEEEKMSQQPTRQAENTSSLGTQERAGGHFALWGCLSGFSATIWYWARVCGWSAGSAVEKRGWMRRGWELQDPLGDSSPHLIRVTFRVC